jgi:hypothetical protein
MAKDTEPKQGQPVQKAASVFSMGKFEDMERLFDKFFTRGWPRSWRQEWPVRGEFMRSIALPATVDSAKVKASFKGGVLELVIPRSEVRKRHAITVG